MEESVWERIKDRKLEQNCSRVWARNRVEGSTRSPKWRLGVKGAEWVGYLFPSPAETNDHKLDLRQHTFIILQFLRSEVPNGSAALHSFWRHKGKNLFLCLFPASGGCPHFSAPVLPPSHLCFSHNISFSDSEPLFSLF